MFGPTHHQNHHLCKRRRRAEEEADGEQPITKRLARMQIGRPNFDSNVSCGDPLRQGGSCSGDDRMYVDDTKDKVYIHDLESEIAQIEAEEPRGMFLPDIDRKISAIPQRLLQNQTNGANTQMVLYHVPSSISVPEEKDHVRKAIAASRARARERQAQEAGEKQGGGESGVGSGENMNGPASAQLEEEEYDPDAMDLG